MKLLSSSKLASASLAATLAIFFVLSSFVTADARHRYRHRGGAGVAAGIIAGAIIGGAIVAGSTARRHSVRRHSHRHTHYNRRGRIIKRHRHRHNRRHHR